MNNAIKWAGWVVLLLIFGLDLYLLVTGSAWLERPLDAGGVFPIGTLVGWSFLIAWPLLFLLLMPKARPGQLPATYRVLRFVRLMLWIALLLGLGWGFCGRLASGNWANSFANSPRAWQVFTIWSGAILFLPLLAFLIWAVVWLFQRARSRTP
jgi:hypothetical protein